MAERLSIRAYARRRGVSHTAVQKAIKEGRISRGDDGKIDPVKADREWGANTIPAPESTAREKGGNRRGNRKGKRVATPPAPAASSTDKARAARVPVPPPPSEGAPLSLTDARMRKEYALARGHELEVAEREGNLISLDMHEERVQLLCTRLGSKVRGLKRYREEVQRASSDLQADELLGRMIDATLAALDTVADEIEGDGADSHTEGADPAA
jgi:hypothetical protein